MSVSELSRARFLAVGVLVVAAFAAANNSSAPIERLCGGRDVFPRRVGPSIPACTSSGVAWDFAPASGAGFPVSVELCAAVAPMLDGGTTTWCTRGDGTALAGTTNTVATAQGSPVLTTQEICPNGLDCATKSIFRTPSNSGYAEAANVNRNTTFAGSFTACSEFIYSETPLIQEFTALTTSGSAFQYAIAINTGGRVANTYIGRSGCGTFSTGSGLTQLYTGGHYLMCLTWASGDGGAFTYLNGDLETNATFSVASPICAGGSASRFTVGGYWNGAQASAPPTGASLGAFYLGSSSPSAGQLTSAQISSLADAVLARVPASADGGTFNAYSRGSPRGCFNSAGRGTQVSSTVPCLGNNGYQAWQAYTIIDLNNEAMDTWTKTATVTADQAVSPSGILTADQLNDVSAVAFQGVSRTTSTGSQTKHTVQAWVAAGTSSKATLSMTGTGNSAGDCTVSSASIPAGGMLLSCTSPAAYGAGLISVTDTLNVGTVAADTGTILVSYIDHVLNMTGPFPHSPTDSNTFVGLADPGLQTSTVLPTFGPNGCFAASMQFLGQATPGSIAYLGPVGTSQFGFFKSSDTAAGFDIGGTTVTPTVSSMGATVHRALMSDNAGARTAYWDAVSVTPPAASMVAAQALITLGANPDGGAPCNCTVSRVQRNSNPTKCTP